jgi:hypothetical protein
MIEFDKPPLHLVGRHQGKLKSQCGVKSYV